MFWIVFGAYSCYHPLHPTSLGSAPWTVLTFGEFVKDFETRNNGKLRNGNEGFADLLLFDAGFGLRCVQKCVKTHTFASCTGLLVCGSLFTQLTWRVTEVIRLSQLHRLKPQKDSSSLDLHSAHSIPSPPITMTFSALPSGSYEVDKVELNTDFDFCKSKCPTGWDAFDAIF